MKNIYVFFCILLCAVWSVVANAANEQCAEIDHEFLFFGDWISLSEHSTKGPIGKLSIRNSQPRPQLNRSAGITIASVEHKEPKSIHIVLNKKTQKAEILPESLRSHSVEQIESESNLEFVCAQNKWQRESTHLYRTSESGRQYTRTAVSLDLDQAGNLIATGYSQNESGFWSKHIYTINWVAKFERKQ